MSLNSKHPSYSEHVEDWQLMRHAYLGERVVKAQGETYLPATPGQVLDGCRDGDVRKPGYVAYQAYKSRARFPDYTTEAVVNFVGLMHQKDAEIQLPALLEPLRNRATVNGESLLNLLRRINEQQLIPGRLALMLDFPSARPGEHPLPYIALYYAESIINWDESADGEDLNALNLVVLDESGSERDPNTFAWHDVERYRVLQLRVPTPTPTPTEGDGGAGENGAGATDPTEGGPAAVYMQGVFEGRDFSPVAMVTPMYRSNTLNKLPLVIINAQDCVASVSNPPLLGLARECVAIYRAEADYRYTLFMQGQDTFVTVGQVSQGGQHIRAGDDAIRLGAGAHVAMEQGGSASYEGIGAEGLAEQRAALENDHKAAAARSGKLISPQAGRQESGDALSTRLAAQTVSLTSVAAAGAAGLEAILRIAAEWMGADPKEAIVSPNKEFSVLPFSGQDATSYMQAKNMGFPLSEKSLHGILRDRKMTPFTYEEELKLIEKEDAARAKRVAVLAPKEPTPAAKPPAV